MAGKIIDAWDDLNDIRGRMADPTDTTPRVQAARATCDAYGSAPGPVAGALSVVGASTLPLDYACQPYWDDRGYDAPQEAPPFSGGQCPGVLYRVTVTSDLFGEQVISSSRRGPILPGGNRNQGTESSPSWFGFYLYGPNQTEGQIYDGANDNQNGRVVSVERVDELPDDCGNPPPSPQPGANPPPSTPIGSPVDRPVHGTPTPVTVLPPARDPFGVPFWPVEVGDEPYYVKPGPGTPDPVDEQPEPSIGDPMDVDGSGEEDSDPDDEETKPTLLGYRFEVRELSSGFQSVIPGTNPRVYSRIVGSIQLKMSAGDAVFYSDNLQITSQEGSIVKSHPTLRVVGCAYNVLPDLAGLTLYEIRGKDDDN